MFNRMPVNLGPAEYAEPYESSSFLKMPANALVNLSYLLIGIYWLWRVLFSGTFPEGWVWYAGYAAGGMVYGAIQFTRIVTQSRVAAILDQWTTLPFFSGVVAWSLTVLCDGDVLSYQAAIFIISILSYLAAAWYPYEIVLGLHILAALTACILVLQKTHLAGLVPFICVLACCICFVSLKLMDYRLSRFILFRRLTGHFWSKVADSLQIHFIILFFMSSR